MCRQINPFGINHWTLYSRQIHLFNVNPSALHTKQARHFSFASHCVSFKSNSDRRELSKENMLVNQKQTSVGANTNTKSSPPLGESVCFLTPGCVLYTGTLLGTRVGEGKERESSKDRLFTKLEDREWWKCPLFSCLEFFTVKVSICLALCQRPPAVCPDTKHGTAVCRWSFYKRTGTMSSPPLTFFLLCRPAQVTGMFLFC